MKQQTFTPAAFCRDLAPGAFVEHMDGREGFIRRLERDETGLPVAVVCFDGGDMTVACGYLQRKPFQPNESAVYGLDRR